MQLKKKTNWNSCKLKTNCASKALLTDLKVPLGENICKSHIR
jgi:hypothetical protein